MNMQRLLIGIVLIIAGGALAFAAGEVEAGGAAGADFPDADIVNPSGFPIVDEMVTLSFAAQRAEDNQDKEGWAWFEDKTNVRIDLEIISQSAYWEKMNIKLATNDLNDLMDVGEKTDSRRFADDGFFYPLNGLIEAYGETTSQWIEARPNVWEYQKGSDGQFYGWPWTTAESLLSLHRHYLWVDKNWLENVGLEPPTTTDEFYEMLVAFRDLDANANGDPNDEIPFSSSTGRPVNDSSSPLIMPWLSAYQWLEVDDGTVTSPLDSEEFREAIAWQAELFAEGLMYEESLTQDRSTQWAVNERFSEYNTIGSYIGQHQNWGMSWDSPKWRDYIALEPLEGPNGVKNGVWSAPTGRIDIVISADTEYPATAFRWMDHLYSEEGQLARNHGLEGVHWREARAGELDLSGGQARWFELADPDSFAINGFIQSDWGGIGGIGDKFVIDLNPADPMDLTDDGRTLNQVRFQAAQVMSEYIPPLDEQWPNPPIPAEIVEEYAIVRENVVTLVSQFTAQFIVGQRNVDTQWDGFMRELDRAGLDRYVELSQIAYDAFTD